MDRTEKSDLVTSLNASLATVSVVVVARNLGLTVAQTTDLRTKMRAAGASFKVTKNKLAKLAIDSRRYSGSASPPNSQITVRSLKSAEKLTP